MASRWWPSIVVTVFVIVVLFSGAVRADGPGPSGPVTFCGVTIPVSDITAPQSGGSDEGAAGGVCNASLGPITDQIYVAFVGKYDLGTLPETTPIDAVTLRNSTSPWAHLRHYDTFDSPGKELEIWYLVGAEIVGDATLRILQVNWTGSGTLSVVAIGYTFFNENPVSPFAGTATNTGVSANPNGNISTVYNRLLIDWVAHDPADSPVTPTPGAGQAFRVNCGGGSNPCMSEKPAANGTVTMEWTYTAPSAWFHLILDIRHMSECTGNQCLENMVSALASGLTTVILSLLTLIVVVVTVVATLGFLSNRFRAYGKGSGRIGERVQEFRRGRD